MIVSQYRKTEIEFQERGFANRNLGTRRKQPPGAYPGHVLLPVAEKMKGSIDAGGELLYNDGTEIQGQTTY